MTQLAQILAHWLAKNSSNIINEDEIRYGIEVMLGGFLQAALLLLLALWLNLLPETVGILLASAWYRRYAGGAHCTAYYRCTLTSLITFLPLAYLARFLLLYTNLVTVSCGGLLVLIIAWLKAPVDNPANPINDPLRRQSLRNKSMFTIILLILSAILLLHIYPLGSTAIMLGLLWQSVTLTMPGHLYMSAWDNLFIYIERKIRKGDYYAQQS